MGTTTHRQVKNKAWPQTFMRSHLSSQGVWSNDFLTIRRDWQSRIWCHSTLFYIWSRIGHPQQIPRWLQDHAQVLFSIGTGSTFNFGKLVFKIILQFAQGGLKSTELPFPSLIYGILESHEFILNIDEELSNVREPLKIAHAYFKGNQSGPLVDWIWCCAGCWQHILCLMWPNWISSAAKEIIAHYEAQVAEYRLILDVGLHSGQAGREWGAGLGLPKCLIKQDLPTQVSMQGSSLD